ncbi:hypothetical protein [Streptomyces sp. NBC_00059]|uniref:hypothetical protein n=1 Tax=Streptomyces sp. NBC_00059 TaxID=2975635 RepID=UPI00224E83AA|nr:hypothetical protein [Streptomyces sp. NBC_00059]MCX5413250.1 hypothetical protein [Streptomyces sp. NBC_00059]
MIITAAPAADSTPTGVLAFLAVLGIAAIWYGGRWAFDIRGAIGATLARRRAALDVKAQQTGNLGLTQTDGIGPLFFRCFGIIITTGGLILLALSAILATT